MLKWSFSPDGICVIFDRHQLGQEDCLVGKLRSHKFFRKRFTAPRFLDRSLEYCSIESGHILGSYAFLGQIPAHGFDETF